MFLKGKFVKNGTIQEKDLLNCAINFFNFYKVMVNSELGIVSLAKMWYNIRETYIIIYAQMFPASKAAGNSSEFQWEPKSPTETLRSFRLPAPVAVCPGLCFKASEAKALLRFK